MTEFNERRVNLLLREDIHSVTMRYRTTLRFASCVAAAAAIAAIFSGASVYAQGFAAAPDKSLWSGLTLPPQALAEPEAEIVIFASRPFKLTEQSTKPPQGGVELSLSSEAQSGPLFNDFALESQPQPLVAEMSATATSVAGGPLDFGISQRARLEDGDQGRIIGRGAEVRVGQGLADLVGASSIDPSRPAWYFFAASDGQALTWAPGTLEGLAYQQQRVTVGDLQAGFSYELHGVQTSFSYLQREVSNSTRGAGAQSRSETESFVGATITVRR